MRNRASLPVPFSSTSNRNNQTAWLDELTKREKEVLLLLAKGHNNKTIADELFITEQTVRNHVSMIYSKIGVHDRIEVMLLVNKMNLLVSIPNNVHLLRALINAIETIPSKVKNFP